MKRILIIAFLLASTVTAFAIESSLVGGDKPVQAFAPNGALSAITSVNSSVLDLSENVQWALYSGSGTCFYRSMPTNIPKTSYRGAYLKVPVSNTTWHIRAKNPATPFVNISGCVAGFTERQ
jgi:hypothetical protein